MSRPIPPDLQDPELAGLQQGAQALRLADDLVRSRHDLGSRDNQHRRMLPSLLSVLEFRSNNTVWRPVLVALEWIRSKMHDGFGLCRRRMCRSTR
jgi:hypothetical protein